MVDVHTVSAGGGSIAWADGGGALRVGPHSAGARPGPASYGLGGIHATVTDADLYLGTSPTAPGSAVRSCWTTGSPAMRSPRSVRPLGLTPLETAVGVAAIAEAEMVRALRVISIERGFDPRDFTLVAFGGAGGMHACRLAEELEITTVLVPRAGGVLSALGLAISDLRRDYVAALVGDAVDLDPATLESAFEQLERRAVDEQPGAVLRRFADLRYRGQSFELTVPAGDLGLAARFSAAHRRRYGFEMTAGERADRQRSRDGDRLRAETAARALGSSPTTPVHLLVPRISTARGTTSTSSAPATWPSGRPSTGP